MHDTEKEVLEQALMERSIRLMVSAYLIVNSFASVIW